MDKLSLIYNAGVAAESVPYFVGMRTADIERLYTSGYMAYWELLDKEVDILPSVATFIGKMQRDYPKLAADLAAYRACSAKR